MPDLLWIFSRIDLRATLDIFIVASIIFWLLGVAQGTRSALIIRGLLIVAVVMWIASRALNLTAVGFLLSSLLPVIVLSIPIIFQPELRRLLEQIGQTGWLTAPLSASPEENIVRSVDEISRAAAQLSRIGYGALMVIERNTGLQDYADRGVALDATVSANLLFSIFVPNTPLHDGAIIIREGRIVSASVVLPLTENIREGERIGTRHRAAMGITEESDALSVVVSEETGRISVAHHGRLVENLDQERLRRALRTLLRIENKSRRQQRRSLVSTRSSRRSALASNGKSDTVKPTDDTERTVSWESDSDD